MLHASRSLVAAALLSLGLAACGGNVVVDGDARDLGLGVGLGQGEGGGTQGGDGSAGGTSTSTGTGTATATGTGTSDPPHPTPALPIAIAMRQGDVPGGGMGGMGGSGPGEDPVSPDDTFLVVSGYGASCESPYSPGGCVQDWRLFVIVPVAKLVPGTTLDLATSHTWFSATQPGGDGSCSGAGGSLQDGTLTLGAILADGTITGTVTGLDLGIGGAIPPVFDFAAVWCAGAAQPGGPPQDEPACAGEGASCGSDADCCSGHCGGSGRCDP